MKISSLTITDFRGIRHLSIPLEGRSAVIWGDNGVGKSGVVDAVDFLLRGDVTRLSGRGAGGLSLLRHGPHVRAKPEHARVDAEVILDDGATHQVSRSVSQPNALVADPAVSPEFLRVSGRGQHLLTRRDILSVVTVPPGDRGAQINELLNLSPIEQVRKQLVTLRNAGKTADTAASDRVTQQRMRLAAISDVPAYDHDAIVGAINEQRQLLALDPIATLDDDAAAGAPPTRPLDEAAARRVTARTAVSTLAELLVDSQLLADIRRDFQDVRDASDSLLAIVDHERILSLAAVVDGGISLLDGTGMCPLCDTQWDAGRLADHLNRKHDTTRAVREAKQKIAAAAERLRTRLNGVAARASAALDAVAEMDPAVLPQWFSEWNTTLGQTVAALADPVDALSTVEQRVMIAAAIMPDESLAQRFADFAAAIPIEQEPQARTQAREQLIRTDQEVRNLRDAETETSVARRLATSATLLHDSFLASRDEVLHELYEAVRDRFVELYRFLHPEEAESFTADLGPDQRGGVDLAVDFHAVGRYSPNAVHSEGHQDSMGLCLFLALAEVLTGGAAPALLLLDDVVMSVDMDHRAKVAELLKVYFPTTQFILTTHDRAWASYLQSSGVIRPADRWEFRTWNLESGPSVGRAVDVWTRIESQLDDADVPAAAETLRRHVEETLFNVCDAIRAPVRLRATAQYQAGDLVGPAFETLKTLIAKGIRRAQDLNNVSATQRLEDRHAARARAHTEMKIHEWSVNAQIHWNELLRLSAAEFRLVTATYREALALFGCELCHSPIRLLVDGGGRPSAVQCHCANVAWAL